MISPSFSDFGFASTVLLNGTPNAGTANTGNEPGTEDSFQSILAQAVNPPADAEPLRSLAERQPGPASGASAQNSDRTWKSTGRTAPSRASAGKTDHGSHTAHAEISHSHTTANAANGNGAGTLSVEETATSNSASNLTAFDKRETSGSSTPQSGFPVSASTALGGIKALSGAAFALHITPSTNPVNANAPANASAAKIVASDANPSSSNSGQDVNVPGSNPNGLALPIASVSSANSVNAQPVAQSTALSNFLMASTPSWTAPQADLSSTDQTQATETAPPAAEISEIASEDSTGVPQTIRTLQLQLGSDEAGRVDVRLVEHAGGLSVSVRASDNNLTRGLQDNLPELSASLAAEKYQTHSFLPAASEASNGQASSHGSDQSFGQGREQSGGGSFSQGGSSAGGDGNPQQGAQQDQSQAWWRQLAALNKLSAGTSTSGLSSQSSSATNAVLNQ